MYEGFCFVNNSLFIGYTNNRCNGSHSDHKALFVNIPESKGNITPKYRLGERFALAGDFNGDGVIDTIYESYISSKSNGETYMDMDTTDWEENIKLIIGNKPFSRLYTNIRGIDTFIVTDEPQQRGLLRLENLGNINGDKGDELGYVINWADFSNINSYHVITLVQNKWVEICNFRINEAISFQPENLFDSIHIIKPLLNGRIRYRYYGDGAEVRDSVISFSAVK